MRTPQESLFLQSLRLSLLSYIPKCLLRAKFAYEALLLKMSSANQANSMVPLIMQAICARGT